MSGTASENAGTARITLRRNAGSAGAVSIDYATSDGTAVAGADYAAASGRLNWAAGDLGERTISVALVNDTATEANETFRITLSNATGGVAIEGSSTIDVTISDNDAVIPPGPGSGGGGGGAADFWLLLLAGLPLLGIRRGRPARSPQR